MPDEPSRPLTVIYQSLREQIDRDVEYWRHDALQVNVEVPE